jgi:hypothetical protein
VVPADHHAQVLAHRAADAQLVDDGGLCTPQVDLLPREAEPRGGRGCDEAVRRRRVEQDANLASVDLAVEHRALAAGAHRPFGNAHQLAGGGIGRERQRNEERSELHRGALQPQGVVAGNTAPPS